MSADDARTQLEEILATTKRGYVNAIKARRSDLVEKILALTVFSDVPDRDWKTRIWYVLNGLNEYPKCAVCGKPVVHNIYRLADPKMLHCSYSCGSKDPETQRKAKSTNSARYGDEIALRSDAVRAKLKASIARSDKKRTAKAKSKAQQKIWSDESRKTAIMEKTKATNRLKFGADFFSQTEQARQRAAENLRLNHSKSSRSKKLNFYRNEIMQDNLVEPMFSAEEYTTSRKSDKLKWKCKTCSHTFSGKIKPFYFIDGIKDGDHRVMARCPKCHPRFNTASLEEKHLANFLRDICGEDVEVTCNKESNFKVIPPYQLDIVVRRKSDKRIMFAVEYDGSRWHSVELRGDRNRQLVKTRMCEKSGIPLVHVFEDEWLNDRARIEGILRSYADGKAASKLLGVYGTGDRLTVDRAKFCSLVVPDGYVLAGVAPAKTVKRVSAAGFGRKAYNVLDCGKIILVKDTD